MLLVFFLFFFFNDTATTEIYTLSLHDALPISAEFGFLLRDPEVQGGEASGRVGTTVPAIASVIRGGAADRAGRSEEHTSELQSRLHLVCRLLLEKKKKMTKQRHMSSSATKNY